MVCGVEPNAAMRQAAESFFVDQKRFRSVDGTAEATGLPAACADFVTVGQAFHWFNRHEARREFCRVLRPSGWVMLIWNERAINASAFGRAYEQLLIEFATEYESVSQRSMSPDTLVKFFTNGFSTATLANGQHFDFVGLKGRLLSSSYSPEARHPQHESMIAALRRVFDLYQVNHEVIFEYDTNVYYGHL